MNQTNIILYSCAKNKSGFLNAMEIKFWIITIHSTCQPKQTSVGRVALPPPLLDTE